MAGIWAASRGAQTLVLDSQKKIGAKILVAGGGRCNVTNEYVHPSRFHSGSPQFVDRVLHVFNVDHTHQFFQRIGVPLKLEETGKFFPVADSGRVVLQALLDELAACGGTLRTEAGVETLKALSPGWEIIASGKRIFAKAVIVCTGGLALPKSGSNGFGYKLVGALGHSIVQTTPALSPLVCSQPVHQSLSGITLPVRLWLEDSGTTFASYSGSFLFTHFGYSGPAALNLSRHVARDRWDHPKARVWMSLFPEASSQQQPHFLAGLLRQAGRKSIANALAPHLPRRVVDAILRHAQIPEATPASRLDSNERQRLAESVFRYPLEVAGVAGYTKAEATAGGVCLEEIEPATMMSRIQPGLFMAGEILDVDGWLGGYNFQWAWSSGAAAGRAAARYALKGG